MSESPSDTTPAAGPPVDRATVDPAVELTRALSRLRKAIRASLLLRAGSLLLVAVLGAVIVTFALDRLFRLSVPARVVLLVAVVAGLGWLAWRWLIRPWAVRLDRARLADIVERQHPELLDRLRSGLDFLRDDRVASATPVPHDPEGRWLAVRMKQRAVAEAAGAVHRIDPADAIDTPGVVAVFTGACALLVLGIAIAAPLRDTVNTWYQRVVCLSTDVEWPYQTRLSVDGFTAPDYTVRVPRGDPLPLQVHAAGEAPRRVLLRIAFGDDRRRYTLANEGEMRFVHEEPSVTEPFEFTVEGGDYTTPIHRVEVLARPRVEELEIRLVFPEYTGIAARTESAASGEISLPEGTTVHLRGKSSKTLDGATLLAGGEQLDLPVDPNDRHGFRGVFRPAASGRVEVILDDSEGVPQERAFGIVFHVVPDRPPTVRARPRGVGRLVTARAILPFELEARDDHGVTGFGLRWETRPPPDETASGPEDEASAPARTGEETFTPPAEVRRRVAAEPSWDLVPVALEPGTRLDLSLTATDNDEIHGAKTGESDRLSFIIVTAERLGEELLRREVEQRRALERALELERAARDEVYRLLGGPWKEEGALKDETLARMAQTARGQRQIARQVTAIGGAIAGILEEMRNNRIAEADDTERLAQGIVGPLQRIGGEALPGIARGVAELAGEADSLARVERGWEVAREVDRAVTDLERILANLRRMEGFTEIVRNLEGIIRTHREATEEARRLYEEAVDQLFEDDDIFENDPGTEDSN